MTVLTYTVSIGSGFNAGVYYVHEIDQEGHSLIICNTSSKAYADKICNALNSQEALRHQGQKGEKKAA